MIGNSIKSDVNPALAVGMGAVFIPNDNTWALEHAELDPAAPRLLQLDRFAQLTAALLSGVVAVGRHRRGVGRTWRRIVR